MPHIGRWAFFILSGFLCLSVSEAARSQVPSQTSTQEGRQLLHKMQTALGGAEKIAAIRDYEETVRARTLDDSGLLTGEVRKRTRWVRNPNLLRLDQIGPRDTYVLYFDGRTSSGWEILPDVKSPDKFKTTGKAIELTGSERSFARNYLSGFQFNTWLADRMPGYVVMSPAQNVLRIEHDGTADDIALDPATWLPIKTAGVSLADPGRPVSDEMRCEGWTEVAGVRFPTKRDNYHNGVKLAELTAEAIRVNPGLVPQELAAKPAHFASDIPRQ